MTYKIKKEKDVKTKRNRTPFQLLVKANVFAKAQIKTAANVEHDNNTILDEMKNLQVEETKLKVGVVVILTYVFVY